MRVALSALLLVSAALPAYAQMETREGIALQNEILELRSEVQSLQAQIANGGGGTPAPQPYAYAPAPAAPSGGQDALIPQLLDRVNRLEEQTRDLRGRVDELTNQLQRQSADLAKQIGDLSFQLQQAQGGAGRPPGATTPPTVGAPPMGALGAVPQPPPQPGPLPLMPATPGEAQAPAPRTPEIAMQAGLAALGRRDYAAAEAAAREILARGNSPRAYDAQFLLARALAGERNYQAAAVAFDDTYKRAQTGPHAPESLLGLANALISLNSNQAACGALERLRAEFPQARADLREEATALRRRAGCR